METKDIVYVNGSFLSRAEARISVEDRGFVFGDGVYEVLRAINGRLFATRFHNQRLERSLEGIRISLKGEDSPGRFVEIGKQLLKENRLLEGEAMLYMQVTRGASTRVHTFPSADTAPTIYISVNRFTPYTDLAANGASAITHPDHSGSKATRKLSASANRRVAKPARPSMRPSESRIDASSSIT